MRYSFRFALVITWFLLLSYQIRADTIYVWCDDGTIQKCDTNGTVSLFTSNNISGDNGPVGLALDNAGNLYAGAPGDSRIWKFNQNGSGVVLGTVDSVSGLAFDGSGNLYITIPNYNTAGEPAYGSLGYYLSGLSTNQTIAHLGNPVTLAFDASNNFYVANSSLNTIEKFSSNFVDEGAFATNLSAPFGLAFDATGNLFVANSGTNFSLASCTIEKFTPSGVGSFFAGINEVLYAPEDLAFDSAGYLYVANSGAGNILKFSSNGISTVFASGLNSPASIAIFPGRNVWSASPLKLNVPVIQSNGIVQISLSDNPGLNLALFGTTNLSLPFAEWTPLGRLPEIAPGQYQFSDTSSTNTMQRFYRIESD